MEQPEGCRESWPTTLFDTEEWRTAWVRSTIETVTASDIAEPGMYAVKWSPFWAGYEADAGLISMWDRPLLTIGSLYSFYGPSYLVNRPGSVEKLMDRAAERADEWDTAGFLVANLPEEAALDWAEVRPPDATVRLDVAYHRTVSVGEDAIAGGVSRRVLGDWRRRWRRASELGLHVVEETQPDGARIDEILDLANASATRHGWPPVYDRTTANEVLGIPGARLLRAEWSGQTVAGFIALEHDRRLYLWAGGTHPALLREVSPYLFVLYELLSSASDRGWDRIEFGRGNDAFKRKYGFDGTELWSLWYARRAEEVPVYRKRITTLHERLGLVMGLAQRGLGQACPVPEPVGAND
jgi:hypothetical protein